jgi:hypothetical protein
MIKRADWVTTIRGGGKGIVKRVAKDGSWADIDWGGYTKRMSRKYLIILTTIETADGFTVTDLTRQDELSHE